jgi:hypothetical protein
MPIYDAAEVGELVRRKPPVGGCSTIDGESTALAFELLSSSSGAGHVKVDIVKLVTTLRLRAVDAEQLAADYTRLCDAVMLPGVDVRAARRLLLDEHPDEPLTGELLVLLVTERTQRFAAEREALLAANKAAVEESRRERDEALAREKTTAAKLGEVERERDVAIGKFDALAALLNAAEAAAPLSGDGTSPAPPQNTL